MVFSYLGFSGKNMREMDFWNVGQLFLISVKYSVSTFPEMGHIFIHDTLMLVNWENSLDGSWPTG